MKNKFIFLAIISYQISTFANTEICVVGDTGTGTDKQYKVAEAMYKSGCKTILHTGDVIYERGVQSETDFQWKSKFEDPNAMLIQSGAEFYMSMGNHDHSAAKKDKVGAIHKAYADKNVFYKFFGLYYNFKIGNTCFWAVDTDSFDEEQQKNVSGSMSKASDCDWKIAFGHHPIISSGKHGDSKPKGFLRKRLAPILTDHADIYFSGHDHNLADEGFYPDEQGFRQLISGAGAKLRDVKRCSETGCVFAESKLGFVKALIKTDSVVVDYFDVELNLLHSLELKK